MIQDRRITDKLPGRPLQWEEGATPSAAPAADAPMPNAELERIAEEFRMHADSDDDAELRAGGEKRLIAFDYFKRGWITTKGAAPAAGQAGLAKLQRFEPAAKACHGGPHAYMEADAQGEYYAVADVEALFAALAAPVAADTEQATDEQQDKSGRMPPFAAPASQHSANCPDCHGTGQADSGGVHPWGEPAMIACGCDDLRTAVARAIWGIRRSEEDRDDMELEDMGEDHTVWLEADAAIDAASGFREGRNTKAESAAPLATPADAGAGLTEQQIIAAWNDTEAGGMVGRYIRFARAIEVLARMPTSGAPVTASVILMARSPEGDPWQEVSAEDFFKARRNGYEVSVCVNKDNENSIRLEAPAPVAAEPAMADLSASSLVKLWDRANAAATDTMPAPFQFAKLLLANAPTPADRDAIRDQALEDAAVICDLQASDAECPERAIYCADAIRDLKSMERAADAKGDQ